MEALRERAVEVYRCGRISRASHLPDSEGSPRASLLLVHVAGRGGVGLLVLVVDGAWASMSAEAAGALEDAIDAHCTPLPLPPSSGPR
jgi:hypothetical protein